MIYCNTSGWAEVFGPQTKYFLKEKVKIISVLARPVHGKHFEIHCTVLKKYFLQGLIQIQGLSRMTTKHKTLPNSYELKIKSCSITYIISWMQTLSSSLSFSFRLRLNAIWCCNTLPVGQIWQLMQTGILPFHQQVLWRIPPKVGCIPLPGN